MVVFCPLHVNILSMQHCLIIGNLSSKQNLNELITHSKFYSYLIFFLDYIVLQRGKKMTRSVAYTSLANRLSSPPPPPPTIDTKLRDSYV